MDHGNLLFLQAIAVGVVAVECAAAFICEVASCAGEVVVVDSKFQELLVPVDETDEPLQISDVDLLLRGGPDFVINSIRI